MQTLYLVKTLAASSANNIALSQTTAGAANLSLNGSTAGTLDTQRRVLITNGGNDLGITFTVTGTGTDRSASYSETLTGTNGSTVATTQDFLVITSIKTSGATSASGVTVGTNTTGSTPWKVVNWQNTPVSIGIGVNVSGTVTYTVEHTYDDITGTYVNPQVTLPTVFPNDTLNALTANGEGSYQKPISAFRLTVTSGTGTATASVLVAGIAGS